MDRFTKDLMPAALDSLPDDFRTQLDKIRNDEGLDHKERRHKIKELWKTLPDDVSKSLPVSVPPGIDQLPEETQAKFRAVTEDAELSFHEKKKRFKEIAAELPEEEREKLGNIWKRGKSWGRGRGRRCGSKGRGCWKPAQQNDAAPQQE